MQGPNTCKNCGALLNTDGSCPKCSGVFTVSSDSNFTLTSTTTTSVVGPGTITPVTSIPYEWIQPPSVKIIYTDIEDDLNTQLLILHKAIINGELFDFDNFKNKCHLIFDSNRDDYALHDRFYQSIGKIWLDLLKLKRYAEAENLWDKIYEISDEWDNINRPQRLHKGTLFYFWGVTCLIENKLDEAFLFMHKAKEEDLLTYGPKYIDKPAHAFITLDKTVKKQFLRDLIDEISYYIGLKINTYNSTRRGSLTFEHFQNIFLKQVNDPIISHKSHVEEMVFYFIYSTFRLRKILVDIKQNIKDNIFGSLLEINSIFDLCLVIDSYIKSKYATPQDAERKTFGNHLKFLSNTGSHGLTTRLQFQNLGDLNYDFTNDFQTTLDELIKSAYVISTGVSLTPIDEDFAITYGLRNFGGHRIEDQPIIIREFSELTQRVYNALFFLVENFL